VTLDRRGFRFVDSVFVIARHDGTPSSYTLWSFQSDDSPEQTAYNETELKSLKGVISVDGSGRTVLDQSQLPEVSGVAFGRTYWSERELVTSRWAADYLPLFQPRIVLRHLIVIKGAPVSRLDFSVSQLGGAQATLVSDPRPDKKVELHYRLDQVAFPGQATLVSWKPKIAPAPAVAQ
jgi:hypothetical protein